MKKKLSKRLFIFLVLITGFAGISIFVLFSQPTEVRKFTDPDFVLLKQDFSPDQNHVALSYQYDTGAFGYSRVWWAVVPKDFEDLNLAKFELPDGYKITGWAPSGILMIEKWDPYYFPKDEIELATGNNFHGVSIRVEKSK